MAFMSEYFKKKSNNAAWPSPRYSNNNKRKHDDVDVAVKRLKHVLIDSDLCNTKVDNHVITTDCVVEKINTDFPSLQLKSVMFMSKYLSACLCQCSEDGISIFLEDMFRQGNSIILKFTDVEEINVQSNNCVVFIHIVEGQINYVKERCDIDPQKICMDRVGSKIIRLNCSEQETEKALQVFRRHVNQNLKIRNVKVLLSPLKSDDGFCEEVSTTVKGIDVKSFYGSSTKTIDEPAIHLISDTPKDLKVTRSNSKKTKTCSNCNKEFSVGKFSLNLTSRCHDCDRKIEDEDEDVVACEDLATGSTEPVSLFVFPPPPSVGRISFSSQDLLRLEPGEFFNDVNIDFYLKFFHQEIMSPEDRDRTHIFSSFFHTLLTSVKGTSKEKAKLRHERVRNWTRNVDIFSKDFIIVPINQKCHWFLAIICFPSLCHKPKMEKCCLIDDDDDDDISEMVMVNSNDKASLTKSDALNRIAGYLSSSDEEKSPSSGDATKNSLSTDVVKHPTILIFDSLAGGKPRWDISGILRQYLQMEWNDKKNSTLGEEIFNSKALKGCVPNCPQQNNYYDCGPYLLLFVQHFYLNPIKNFTPPIKNLKKWFSKSDATQLRVELKTVVTTLTKKHNQQNKLNNNNNNNNINNGTL